MANQQASQAAANPKAIAAHNPELQKSGASKKATVVLGWEGFGFYEVHALWLRDACRDAAFVKASAGERLLGAAPCNTLCFKDQEFGVNAMDWKENALHVEWSDGKAGALGAEFLKAYLPVVGKKVKTDSDDEKEPEDLAAFIRPYMGSTMGGPKSGSVAPPAESMRMWGGKHGFIEFETLDYKYVYETPEGNLELLKVLLRDGACKVGGLPVPEAEKFSKDNMESRKKAINDSANTLIDTLDRIVGGLQKDPSREEPNWVIERRPEAASVSYNPDLRLNNHTDQSLPNHGIPGLLLCVLYADGNGENTLVDGFAVAEKMREEDKANGTRMVELLSKYGNEQLRDVAASRQDAAQQHKAGLQLYSQKPILQADGNGNIFRLQYNEVFRQPCEVPFDDFEDYYDAYGRFVELIHLPEFEVRFPVTKGELMMVQNWRVMHGRNGNMDGSVSGLQSPDRLITGGTVTRESVVSRARQLVERVSGKTCYGPNMLLAKL